MKYQEYVDKKVREYGEKFDTSSLAEQFVQFFESGERVEIETGGEIVRGRVGVSSGWKPCFLLMRRTSDMGSSYTLSANDKVLRVISK